MVNVYLDTSFFIALIENQKGRREEALRIIRYETAQKSSLFTSVLTHNEFLIKYFERFKDEDDCSQKLDEIVERLRQAATPYAISEEIARKAAEIQCAWREVYRQFPEEDPRDRKFRWDAIHLATANALCAVRVYAWDNKWSQLPAACIPDVGTVITPAVCPEPASGGQSAADRPAPPRTV